MVLPWLGTAVPWFSIALGAALAATGTKVSFVLDDGEFGARSGLFRFILHCIRHVLSALPAEFEVLTMGATAPTRPLDTADEATLARLAQLNLVWEVRGEMISNGESADRERMARQLRNTLQRVDSFLSRRDCGCILIPGGVHGNSGIWMSEARRRGIRCASFDSGGRGLLTVATDGVACQLADIPRAFALLRKDLESAQVRTFVAEAAAAELQRRTRGVDRFSSQLPKTEAVDPRFHGSALIALNSSWDSAALGLHEVFDDGPAWIVETTRFILENSTAPVVVRQHPAERFPSGRSTDDYRALLEQHFSGEPRVHFIAAADPVNSYELLQEARVVVVHTSTIGIEAAYRGKVVVTGSSSYYSTLGFVWRAAELQQYRAHLADALAGRSEVSGAMRADAAACYYLTQCCNWISAPLSPEGYDDWIDMRLQDIIAAGGTELVCAALRDNVPVSFLAHRERLGEGRKS